MLYVSCESFIPILLFFQNLGGWFGVLFFFFSNLLFFGFLSLYYSQIINNFLSLLWRYISFFRYFVSSSFMTVSELFLSDVFQTCNSTVVLPSYRLSNFVANQITISFWCFLDCFFRSSSKCICGRLFSMIKTFLTVFTVYVFTYIFTNIFTYIFTNIRYLGWTE